jgi:phage gpG-like protein
MSEQFPVPNFRKIAEEALKDLPKEVSEKARAYFMQSFIREGFTDNSFIPWVKRKDLLSHKMLQLSLSLKGSLKVTEANFNNIEITAGEGLKHAAIHNEGGTITVKLTEKMRKYFWFMFKETEDEKYKWMAISKKEVWIIKIPKRQFIGESETLNKEIEALFVKRLQEAHSKLKF